MTFIEAVRTENAQGLAPHVDNLRHAKGFNYQQIYDLAKKVTGVSMADWDQLMYDMEKLK